MRWSVQSVAFPYIISRMEIREGKRLGPILKTVIVTQARTGGVRDAGCATEETGTQRIWQRGQWGRGEAVGKAIQGFLRVQNCWDAGEGQMLWALLSVSSPLLLFSY